jgi:alginate O-acetyltransferase complex protein AlgI
MLFNSYPFVLVFLPVVLLIFVWLAHSSRRQAAAWLVTASLFFYGWWDARYLVVLLGSIAVNFAFGRSLAAAGPGTRRGKAILALAIASNLATLGYFKYAGFLAALVPWRDADPGALGQLVLPLGISSSPSPRSPSSWTCGAAGRVSRTCSITRCSSPISRT